jgi:hypothetical protein
MGGLTDAPRPRENAHLIREERLRQRGVIEGGTNPNDLTVEPIFCGLSASQNSIFPIAPRGQLQYSDRGNCNICNEAFSLNKLLVHERKCMAASPVSQLNPLERRVRKERVASWRPVEKSDSLTLLESYRGASIIKSYENDEV